MVFFGVVRGLIWVTELSTCLQAYFILDELLIAGELQESSKKSVLRVITQQDQFEEQEANEQKNS